MVRDISSERSDRNRRNSFHQPKPAQCQGGAGDFVDLKPDHYRKGAAGQGEKSHGPDKKPDIGNSQRLSELMFLVCVCHNETVFIVQPFMFVNGKSVKS